MNPFTIRNILIQVLASVFSLGCLWVASHAEHLWLVITAAVFFSFSNNTLFSLLHEAVHFTYSSSRRVNDFMGILCSLFFPTGFLFQRTCHFGHHLRNRTDFEIFDYYRESDPKILKFIQFYGILLGLYYVIVPLGAVLYLLVPSSFVFSKFLDERFRFSNSAMLMPLVGHPKQKRMRFEILFSLGFVVSIYYLLSLSWWPTFLCFFAFGLNWGSLQYADHAFSARSILSGAWNLRVPIWWRWVFLNYHFHRAHHENPNVPWYQLGDLVDFNAHRQDPSFFSIYLEMWRGPRPLPEEVQQEVPFDKMNDLKVKMHL